MTFCDGFNQVFARNKPKQMSKQFRNFLEPNELKHTKPTI